jgi:hypothetical protein
MHRNFFCGALFTGAFLLPFSAQAQDHPVSGMVSVNTSQVFDDGFNPSGNHPTLKAALAVPLVEGLDAVGFVNKELGGTLSDEVDAGLRYTFAADEHTSVQLLVNYYAMRELPDIVETSVWVRRGPLSIGALRYTLPHAPDGTRFQGRYRLTFGERASINIGALHERGLGLPRPITAAVLEPSLHLGGHLFLDGKVVIPTHGALRGTAALRFTF